jgi:putative DNA primase/helicase
MELQPHSEANKDTIYLDWNYNPKPQYSFLIDTFMNEVSGLDLGKKQLLYEMIGYSLLKKPVLSKAFVCYGDGCTGKSTFLKLIDILVQDRNTASLSLADLNKEFYAAGLYGKLVNNGDDIDFKGLASTSMFKKLVTGEKTVFNRKYKEPITFANFATLIFTTNKLPSFGDRTDGLYRRLILVEMNHKIEKPNPLFLQMITEADIEYLLMKATEAIHKALKNNAFTLTQSVQDSLDKFKLDQSTIRQFMLDGGLCADDLDGYPLRDLHKEYVEYCRECGFEFLDRKDFKDEVCYIYKVTVRQRKGTSKGDETQRWRFVKNV